MQTDAGHNPRSLQRNSRSPGMERLWEGQSRACSAHRPRDSPLAHTTLTHTASSHTRRCAMPCTRPLSVLHCFMQGTLRDAVYAAHSASRFMCRRPILPARAPPSFLPAPSHPSCPRRP